MFFKQKFSYKEKQNHKPNGFTIIEVLIAMSIFAIGILGLTKMQISAIFGNTSSREYTEASTYNTGQIEKMMILTYDNASLNDGATGQIIQGIYTINWTVTQGDPIPNVKKIHMVATWKDRGRSKTFTADYYKAMTF